MDREGKQHYWLAVYAQVHGAAPLFSRLDVYVEVLNENDNVPLTSRPVYYPKIAENSKPFTPVITLHAYDADKIDKEIIVRNSKEGEIFEGLDNKKYKLKKDMCVISDKSGVLGLGGIIGGTTTSTEFETKNILLEAAYFNPASIRKTARALNINTDAKYRFERGIDPNSIKDGLELATALILEICGGQASKFVLTGKTNTKNKI